MSDSVDLRRLLKSWPYDPDDDTRLTTGDDGRSIMQVRTPLGIEQYELDGRPDGARPHGSDSNLAYYKKKLDVAIAAGKEAEFKLTPAQCTELFNEGTLYYFRYVRLFQLNDWDRTVRDTARNLESSDLVRRYASREEDQMYLEKWRPYILRVNTTAAAMDALEKNAFDRSLRLIKEGINKVTTLQELDDETFRFEYERSLSALRELEAQIQQKRPMSKLEKLEDQLRRAIERQEFEEAATLRDRIRDLKNQQIC